MAYFKYIETAQRLLPNEVQDIEALIIESKLLPSKHLNQIIDKAIGFTAIVGYDKMHTPFSFAALDVGVEGELIINFLYVKEGLRRHGIGRKLLSYAGLVGEKLNKKKMSLFVGLKNENAKRFYESQGFDYVLFKTNEFAIMEKLLESENEGEIE